MSFDDNALSDALGSRHIPHSRSSRKGGKQQAFNPLAMIGTYEIFHKANGINGDTASQITIHGLTEDESALVASFTIGKAIEAMGILAGSRKVMKQIVEELETEDDEEEEVEETSSASEEEERGDEYAAEEEDDITNRRARNFEKNSFRNPKFWLCWRGKVRNGDGVCSGEKNMGYLVWKNNRCEQFEGTISCDGLGWKNVKVRGDRIRKGAAECQLNWMDVELTAGDVVA